MKKYDYPDVKVIGVCINGDTPPELRSKAEQEKFMTEISIKAAEALGASPMQDDDR